MLRSVRARLTLWFLAAFAAGLALFALAVWQGHRTAQLRELRRYVVTQADLALRIIYQAEEKGPVTVVRDSLVGPQVTPELANALEVLNDYVIVLDTTGRALYVSERARAMGADDFAWLVQAALTLDPGPSAVLLTYPGGKDEIFLAARDEDDPRTPIARVVAGSSTELVQEVWRDTLRRMLVAGAVVLVLGALAAWGIAAAGVRPIGDIIATLGAITDGRSLHKRLGGADEKGDELARLAATVNEMIGRLETSFGGLRRFTADASHELKTPLTVLRASIERAMTAPRGSTEQLQSLEEALHEVARMTDLVNGLLTLARADEGRFDLVRDVVLLDAVVRDVAETAQILGEPASLEVVVAECQPVTVEGDATRLRQLLLNLVTNAIKYTPAGGRVTLSLVEEEGSAVITVRDTGIGIAAADLPFIFDRFWRADRSRSRASGRSGTGLGLAISQYIAQAHGGSLTARSRLSRGSTFTLLLPGALLRETQRDAATDAAAPWPPDRRDAIASEGRPGSAHPDAGDARADAQEQSGAASRAGEAPAHTDPVSTPLP
ncbi:MAG: HAMP domain-containing histidine kinase [Gemmatimonadaceae bacterium]|jgi:signal transduction histidine kinase|nr:HAMP domain-containing histidine kinase [Gemmatimonadaceae bacterium]